LIVLQGVTLTECPVMGLLGRRKQGVFPLTHYGKSVGGWGWDFIAVLCTGVSPAEASLSVLALRRLTYDKAEYFMPRIKRAHDSVIAFRAP